MAFLRQAFGRRSYKCDGCGREGLWDDNWSFYGSIGHQETCPADLPTACSDQCMDMVERKIKKGEYKLPSVRMDRNGYHSSKVTERQGY